MSDVFPIPSLEEIHRQLMADFQNRLRGADAARTGDNWKRVRVNSLGILMMMHRLNTVYDELLPDRSVQKIERLGSIYGVPRKQPTIAHKADALRLVGTATSAFTIGDLLAHKDGTRFQLAESGTIPAAGFIDVDVEAIDAGSVGRKNKLEVLTFLAAPSGIQVQAELQKDIDEGGENLEDIGLYRARILDRIQFPGMGGNRNDYEEWALSQPDVTTAYVYPLRQGLGSVDLAFLHGGSGTPRIPTAPQIAAVQAYIDSVRPISVADFRVLTVVAENNDVEMLLKPFDEPQWKFDWDDTAPLSVSTWNGTTRVLKFTTARPPDMDVKDRLIYKATVTRNDGSELVIEALGPAADEVTVKVLTTAQAAAPPVAGNAVYSGGPLVEPARQAILAYFDSLGPARGAHASGTWEDRLTLNHLAGAVEPLDGVFDTSLLTPLANVIPVNDAPAPTIGLIIPRQIIVRKWNV